MMGGEGSKSHSAAQGERAVGAYIAGDVTDSEEIGGLSRMRKMKNVGQGILLTRNGTALFSDPDV